MNLGLEISHFNAGYPRRAVIEDLCVSTLPRGKITVLLGPNGCGKSTLLKNVTSDYHYHTVTAEEERILDDVEAELAKRGYLVEQKKEELQ